MKVLQLISSGGDYGAEHVILHLASEMKRSGRFHPVAGIIKNLYNPHLELAEKCRKNGIETVVFPCGRRLDPALVWNIRSYIKKNGINAVHAHGYKADIHSYLATRGLHPMLISTCHYWHGKQLKMKTYAKLDRFFLRRFDTVVAVSGEIREIGRQSGVKMRVIRNGIDLSEFRRGESSLRSEFGIGPRSRVIGMVGRLAPEKGHVYLLEAAPKILERFPDTVFLIAGEGPLRKELEEKYKGPSVIFTGFRSDIAEMHRCMDIFAMPSLHEGHPIAILEAMGSALPIVASAVGEIPTVIKDGVTGSLVQPGDTDALAAVLCELLEDPDKSGGMGLRAREMVSEEFSSVRMSREYMDIYSGGPGRHKRNA